MDFTFPEEMLLVRDSVRRFVQTELVPLEKVHRDGMPYEEEMKWRKRARDLGFFMMHVPVEYGGSGLGALAMALVLQETNKTVMPADFIMGIDHTEPVSLFAGCSEMAKKKYLEPAIRGELYWGFCMSEPGAGSDARGITTSATRDGDDWILNGTKLWSSRMRIADFGIIVAVTDKEKRGRGGMSMFIVDRTNPGMKVSRAIPTMGEEPNNLKGPTEISLENCRVPGWAVLGGDGSGYKQAQERFGKQRVQIAARCIGTAERALEMAIEYTKQRKTWGETVASRQGVQWMLADATIRLHSVRLMTYFCAQRLDEGADVRMEASIVKLEAAEMACKVIDMAMQLHGGMGYAKELPLELMYRKARVQRIVEGPSEIHRNVIGRMVVDGKRPGI